MFVACPHCGFLVALVLPSSGSGARETPPHCPRCERPLQADAADAAAADSQAPAETETVPDATPAPEPTDDTIAATQGNEPEPVADTGRAPADAPAAATLDAAVAASALPDTRTRPARAARVRVKRDAPSFARAATADAAPRRHDWRALAAVAALILALALQLVLAQRQELAADARWRPLVGAVCAVAQCSLPPWHEPTAYTMLGRNVRPSPGAPGVLRVDASFRNDARWPQRWPTLLLTLSDVDGREVGQRAFAPADYRRGHKTADELAPGQSATVQLDVVEPAPRIVAFTFDFR